MTASSLCQDIFTYVMDTRSKGDQTRRYQNTKSIIYLHTLLPVHIRYFGAF